MKKLSYKTVMALLGAVLLLLQNLGVKLDVEVVDALCTAVGGVLVALGVVLPDKKTENTNSEVVSDEKKRTN